MMLVNMKLDISGLHFKVADFTGPVPFKWQSKNEIDNIGILVL